jgi:hypothetical protein
MRQHRIGDEARAPGVDMAVTSATLAVREEALRHHQMKWSLAHDVQQQRGEIWQHSRDGRALTDQSARVLRAAARRAQSRVPRPFRTTDGPAQHRERRRWRRAAG